MARNVAPYGTWSSPVSPERLVEKVVRLGQLQVSGGSVYWVESRPDDGGREVIVRADPGAGPADVIPDGFYARTRVHEYGGRCYAVGDGGSVVFSNWQDQRLWLVVPGGSPVPLTPEPEVAGGDRYADPVFWPGERWVVCVRERHSASGRVDNDLVAVPAGGPPGDVVVLAEGHDFYGAPRVSPDGSRLAWVTWDLPDMPWDATELWTAVIGEQPGPLDPTLVAGGEAESVTQPRWSPGGSLHYVSDRTGWWNLYDESGTAACPLDAEFSRPDWVFGTATYAFAPDGTLTAVWEKDGIDRLGTVGGGGITETPTPFSYFSAVATAGESLVAIAASPTEAAVVVRIGRDGSVEVLRRAEEPFLEAAYVSVPRPVEFPTGGGAAAHAFVYPPTNPEFEAPDGERPPVVVFIHGGPTSAAIPVFNRGVQFWTTRGFAVADINYRGSSGYGRAYRDSLRGVWGLADVEDCAKAVEWLDHLGLVDAGRAAIRGGSAGGFTTLAALVFTDGFAAGASLYGVADLELLARDTHKFESRYLDTLVGPWPAAAEEYRRRSPVHHVDRITSPLILFQGLDDKVVPPAQSEMMFEALRARGVTTEYLAFEGEQHGFRKAETITAVARAELEFYGRVFGFSPRS